MNYLSGPTLKHFILRQQVISLYRHVIRASKGKCARSISLHLFFVDGYTTGIPDPVTRKETIHWFRSEFERNRDLTDVVSRRDLRTAIRFM
jgi:Complex 1 protein (LYR family)